MTNPAHSPKPPHSTGIFAALRALLGGRGSSALSAVLSVLAVMAGLLALAPSAAMAAQAHAYSFGFGSSGSGAGQLALAANSGVAINDATNDVYVADTGNRRVDEFDANGKFIRMFGKDVNSAGITEGEQNVCNAGSLFCQAGVAGTEPGELEHPVFVAVDDSSSSPSRGDVYVSDGVGAGQSEQQVVTVANATGGTYELSFEGQTTGPITFAPEATEFNERVADAKAAQVALEGLSTIGPGNVLVGSSPENEAHEMELYVNFEGSLKQKSVPQLTANAAALTPAGATVKVRTTVQGTPFVPEAISKFTAAGELVKTWGVEGQLNAPAGQPEDQFGLPDGIAVDASGSLWVAVDGTTKALGDHVYEFNQDGTFKGPGPAIESASPKGIALDNSDDLYVVEGGRVEKFPPGKTVFIGNATGLAVAPAFDELYVDTAGSSIADISPQCVPSINGCAPVQVFGEPQLSGAAGLAVDTSGTVYAANTGVNEVAVLPIVLEVNPNPGSASPVTATSATLNGEVNPEGAAVSECYFEYASEAEYSEGSLYSHTAKCEPDAQEIGSGPSPVHVHADLTGLVVGTLYHYRLLVKKGATTLPGNDEVFSTATGPVVAGAESREVTAGGAELLATVNPEGLPVSSCKFEYGPTTSYGHQVKCGQTLTQIGYGTEPVPVSAQITGLEPNITYHWRLSVSDQHGEAVGIGHTFVYDTTGSQLPDGRAYEMVTPPDKNGASIQNCFGCATHGVEVSGDGSRVIATSIQCFAQSPSCTADRQTNGEPYEFTRTSGGWVTMPLAPPSTMSVANSAWLAGAEEGVALFSMPTGPQREDEWYSRSPAGTFASLGPATPPGRDGIPFANGNQLATRDLSHLVWESKEGVHWPFDQTEQASLYEYAGTCGARAECEAAKPFLVGVKGPRGSNELLSTCQAVLGNGNMIQNALSTDGRTVYFTAIAKSSSNPCKHETVPVNELYARVDGETSEAHTVKISQGTSNASFLGASEDGSRAFFTEGPFEDENLFESECTAHCEGSGDEESKEQRALIDVSEGPGGAPVPGGPRVQGTVARSADGSHVYFVAKGVLTAANREGRTPVAGGENLYVYGRDASYPAGHTAFIARLSQSTSERLGLAEGGGAANVSPDGRFLVFESDSDLTPGTHAGGTQIFRYDTATEQLVRVSIGAQGFNDDGNAGTGDATIVSAGRGETYVGPARGDPTMSDDGTRVFFMSPVGLTPQALNDVVTGHEEGELPLGSGKHAVTATLYAQNVYEWEQAGAPAARVPKAHRVVAVPT